MPDAAFLKTVEDSLVELPQKRMKRLMGEYGLNAGQADLICEEKDEADYFETAVAAAAAGGLDKKDAAVRVANFLLIDVKHLLHKGGLSLPALSSYGLTPERLAAVTVLHATERISTKNAKQTLEAVAAENRDPEAVIRERGWELITDPAVIADAVKKVYAAETAAFAGAAAADNPKRKATLTAFLVGKVLAATSGRADPKIAGKQIEAIITGIEPPAV
jgi:aspartyl-tRNA(Asn)/glutamyl-tRNA(Gln) amidotransferase subunit B